ncbi:MAG: hypothetical protein ACLP0J_12935 [Solirubrobacteraceae bacterium]
MSDFTLPDATGRDVSLSELVAEGPVVLVYRGGWCPSCNLARRASRPSSQGEPPRYPRPQRRRLPRAADADRADRRRRPDRAIRRRPGGLHQPHRPLARFSRHTPTLIPTYVRMRACAVTAASCCAWISHAPRTSAGT